MYKTYTNKQVTQRISFPRKDGGAPITFRLERVPGTAKFLLSEETASGGAVGPTYVMSHRSTLTPTELNLMIKHNATTAYNSIRAALALSDLELRYLDSMDSDDAFRKSCREAFFSHPAYNYLTQAVSSIVNIDRQIGDKWDTDEIKAFEEATLRNHGEDE